MSETMTPTPAEATGPRPDPAAGLYETLLLGGGRVHALDAHLDRLERSARVVYGLTLPDGPLAAIHEHLTAAARAEAADQRARIDAIPQDGRLRLTLTTSGVRSRAPVRVQAAVVPGGLGPHKWRDRRLVEALGSDPVPLLVDADGSVLEAAWGNVWLLDGDTLVTPPADGRILPGVTRARLLARAPELGLEAAERPVTLDEARAAPSLVITSSVRLAVGARFGAPGAEDPVVGRIRAALRAS